MERVADQDSDAVNVSERVQTSPEESNWLADKGLAEIASSPLFYITGKTPFPLHSEVEPVDRDSNPYRIALVG